MKKPVKEKKSHTKRKAKVSSRTTRVTVDFPIEEHRKLKAIAALKGMSLQQFIRGYVMDGVDHHYVQDEIFNSLFESTYKENEDVLKRLADK
jgi:hypothetical protein